MKIQVTGLGIVSALGAGYTANKGALCNEKSGIATAHFNERLGSLFLGQAPVVTDPNIPRSITLGQQAVQEAWNGQENRSDIRTGFISATTVGGMDLSERLYKQVKQNQRVDYRLFALHDAGIVSQHIAQSIGLSGHVATLSTACSSAANALLMGARMLKSGQLDRIVVGGTDALSEFTVSGFHALQLYSKHWCQPFDANRTGLNLGEAAAYLVLENEHSLSLTQNKPLATLTGWGNANDAFHQTGSSPEGKGAQAAMRLALKCAGLSPEQIDYINAHGTATANNDLSEAQAIKAVFEKVPDFSSTKSYTGHTLAAAGAIEAVFSIAALNEGFVPPNLNHKATMPETELTPVVKGKRKEIQTVLSNSFGFGGNNTTLIFQHT